MLIFFGGLFPQSYRRSLHRTPHQEILATALEKQCLGLIGEQNLRPN